jgi:(p)ppGpp synthase/HD superfamily hydrolase
MQDLEIWMTKFEECSYSKRLLKKINAMNGKFNNRVDVQEVKKAIYYARKYHGEQERDSGEPYYSHTIEVAYMLSDYLFDTEALVVAILHDVIEDTDLDRELLSKIFSDEIADQVYDLSRIKEEGGVKISSAAMLEKLWLEGKYRLLIIKQFDRLHNMQTISAKSEEKMRAIALETMNNFVLLSAYLEMPEAESKLVKLCLDILESVDV